MYEFDTVLEQLENLLLVEARIGLLLRLLGPTGEDHGFTTASCDSGGSGLLSFQPVIVGSQEKGTRRSLDSSRRGNWILLGVWS